MVKRELYDITVERLFQAYQNNTLQLHNAYADAVGILVAGALAAFIYHTSILVII